MLGLSKISAAKSLSLCLFGLSLGLSGCISHQVKIAPNKPLAQTSKIYDAPGQIYSLDLSSPAFAGYVNLHNNCTPQGNSLTVVDQIGRYYRIDAINLRNNPKFPNAQNASLKELSQQLYQFYVDLYHALPQGDIKLVQSPLGRSGYQVLYLRDYMTPVGLLMNRRGDYVYVLQHVQPQFNNQQMQFSLSELAKNMTIPGHLIKNSGSELPLSIDLAQSSPAQFTAWNKTAHCS